MVIGKVIGMRFEGSWLAGLLLEEYFLRALLLQSSKRALRRIGPENWRGREQHQAHEQRARVPEIRLNKPNRWTRKYLRYQARPASQYYLFLLRGRRQY